MRGIAAGVIDAHEVLAGAIAAYPHSRTNVVHRVERRGVPVAFVKQRGMASLLDGDDAVANERAALTELAGVGCVPQVLPVDDPAVVWLGAVPGHSLAELPTCGVRPEAACRALAGALARIHTWPVAADAAALPRAPRPWALRPNDLPPSMRGSPADSACTSVLEAVREPEVRAALNHAAERWRGSAWIHGDVSAGNVIVYRGRAVLIDWEFAGVGEPAWDLAAAVTTLRGLGCAADVFLAEYWRLGGPARLDEAVLTVRAIQTAWQVAVLGIQRGDSDSTFDCVDYLDAARQHAESFRTSSGIQ